MGEVIELDAPPAGAAILRFDVERDLEHHRHIAQVLADSGFRGTFYFHTRRPCYEPKTLHAIAEMGHEVGFHHECLDRCHGDFDRARDLFHREVELFRRDGFELLTVCGHGEAGLPKRGYKFNWELFDRFPDLLRDLNIRGEVYHWKRDHLPLYATDTYSSYREFEQVLDRAQDDPRIMMVLVHLHRWRRNILSTAMEVGRDLSQQASNRIFRRRGYQLAYDA